MPSRAHFILAVCSTAWLALSGCADQPTQQTTETAPRHIERSEHDAIAIELSLPQGEPLVGDTIDAVIQATYPPESTIELELPHETWGDCLIGTVLTDAPIQTATRLQRTWRVALVPQISGTLTLSPITLLCRGSSQFASSRPHDTDSPSANLSDEVTTATASDTIRVQTPEATLQVRSTLPRPEQPELLDIHAPLTQLSAATQPAESERANYWWLAGGLAAVAAVIAALLLLRRRASAVPSIPPHVAALQALTTLRDEQLPQHRRFQEFYARLSEIVRHYIEDRFAIRAPEQTTEEFLRESSRSQSLAGDHKAHLAVFLGACDLVKFARYEPPVHEADDALDAAEQFVRQTEPSADDTDDETHDAHTSGGSTT